MVWNIEICIYSSFAWLLYKKNALEIEIASKTCFTNTNYAIGRY